jgi:hypothetical protein
MPNIWGGGRISRRSFLRMGQFLTEFRVATKKREKEVIIKSSDRKDFNVMKP